MKKKKRKKKKRATTKKSTAKMLSRYMSVEVNEYTTEVIFISFYSVLTTFSPLMLLAGLKACN